MGRCSWMSLYELDFVHLIKSTLKFELFLYSQIESPGKQNEFHPLEIKQIASFWVLSKSLADCSNFILRQHVFLIDVHTIRFWFELKNHISAVNRKFLSALREHFLRLIGGWTYKGCKGLLEKANIQHQNLRQCFVSMYQTIKSDMIDFHLQPMTGIGLLKFHQK